jgi:hypothetical protein
MAHNTMYKHLAKHIKAQREKNKVHYSDTLTVGANVCLDELVQSFADEMEQRQPGSFVKQTFLDESGTTESLNEG